MGTHLFALIALATVLFGESGTWAADRSSKDPVAPGSMGIAHSWAPALKQAIGSAYSAPESPVWFTVAQGILTEVYYPSVDMPQIGDLQFIITDGQSYFSEQKRDIKDPVVSFQDGGSAVLIRGTDSRGAYTLEQEIVTDAHSPTVRTRSKITFHRPGLRLFILFKPALDGFGEGNTALAQSNSLTARGALGTHAALVASLPLLHSSSGFVGFNDGWQDLSKHFELTNLAAQAGPGNIALTAEVDTQGRMEISLELALSFGRDLQTSITQARTSLAVPFDLIQSDYNQGWNDYLNRLRPQVRSNPALAHSAQMIKMHEDRYHPGAIVASLSKPAVPEGDRAPDHGGGYHYIWPRDLYHAAMGLLAAGDHETPRAVLQYLVGIQKEDGSWFQNFTVAGVPFWKGLQLDEVAFPILLAAHLVKKDGIGLSKFELDAISRAAQFIATHGPVSPQDRWEEIGGYIPSTLAAEIAALRAATQLTHEAEWQRVAELWSTQLEKWTVVPHGSYGINYYLRVSPTGQPGLNEIIQLANGAGLAYAHEILDGGFLELVRLGVRSAHDTAISNTVYLYDQPGLAIAKDHFYRRYNRDAYGAAHLGGYWPLLTGERGHYALASGDRGLAQQSLNLMLSTQVGAGLIPEQISAPGQSAALGVACPLVWSHAEALVLERSLTEGKIFDQP